MHTLEIPYNLDQELISKLNNIITVDYVNSVFTSPFEQDMPSAKLNFRGLWRDSDVIYHSYPITRSEYEKRIDICSRAFPTALLLQHPLMNVTEDFIKYYIGLGFTKFIVTRKDVAKIIRKCCPSAKITASIIRKTSLHEILTDKEMEVLFDNIVLYFPFNRSIKAIQALPQGKYEYTMLVNCACSVTCPGDTHWFKETIEMPRNHYYCKSNGQYSMEILPDELKYFKEYIQVYKLQGREISVDSIVEEVSRYLSAIKAFTSEFCAMTPIIEDRFSINFGPQYKFISGSEVDYRYESQIFSEANWNKSF